MSRVSWWWFLAWAVAGALWSLVVLGAMTIGIFVLPLALVLTVLLAKQPRATRAGAGGGLVSGLALPLLYVAYLNRDGPGTVCRAFADGGQSCSDEWSPWPFLLVAVALLAGGVAIAAATASGGSPRPPHPSTDSR